MKKRTVLGVFILFAVISVLFKFIVLKKPDTRLVESVQKGTLVETIEVSGTYHKTATEQQKTSAYASYLTSLSQLSLAKNNKNNLDAIMWSKRQALLSSENSIDFKNDNTTNPLTKDDYTDLEKTVIDDAYVLAEKDFRAAEQKYKDADKEVNAASAQVQAAKVAYNELSYDKPVVTVYINEIYVPRISVGQPVTITFDALKDTPLTGRVLDIEDTGDIQGGVVTYETHISIDNPPSGLRRNMTAIVTIDIIRKDNTLSVPMSAIIYNNGKTYVQTIGNENNLAEVTLGAKGLTKVEILSGIEDGTRILSNPNISNI